VPPDLWDELRAKKQAAFLLVAALRELAGMRMASINRKLMHSRWEYHNERSLKRAAANGRKLWRRLDAWPWALLERHEDRWWLRNDVIEAWCVC
jgi:hypothetical protein